MNDDTISRQAAIAYAISGLTRELEGEKWIRVSEVRESLQTMPSAEQHGWWINDNHLIKCSICGKPIPLRRIVLHNEVMWEDNNPVKYCPYCGAKMTHENEEMSKVSETEMAYAEYLND